MHMTVSVYVYIQTAKLCSCYTCTLESIQYNYVLMHNCLHYESDHCRMRVPSLQYFRLFLYYYVQCHRPDVLPYLVLPV